MMLTMRPVGRKDFEARPNLLRAIGPNLYTLLTALLELVANAIDACHRKGVLPWIEIQVLKEDLFFKGQTLVVTDHGCGFRDKEDWDAYLMVGESVHVDQPELLGANGIGKFAALCFNADGFIIRTCSDDGDLVQMLKVKSEEVFSSVKTENFFVDRRGAFPTDPDKGSFTSIIIEDVKARYTPQQMAEDISNHFAVDQEWKITVNGIVVPPKFSVGGDIKVLTDPLPLIGQISCVLGVSESALDDPDRLVLRGGGRTICPLRRLRRWKEIPHIFFHPNLFGVIDVEGWKKESTIAKDQLRATVEEGEAFESFVKGLRFYVRDKVEDALAKSQVPADPEDIVTKNFLNFTEHLNKVFGEPQDPLNSAAKNGEVIVEVDAGETRPGPRGKKPGRVKPTGTGSPHRHTEHPDLDGTGVKVDIKVPAEVPVQKNPLVRIEDVSYVVKFDPLESPSLPSAVFAPCYIVVYTKHPRFKITASRGVKAQWTLFEQISAEAHVRNKDEGVGLQAFTSKVNELIVAMGIR